ncbi:MAG: nickel pincer cofactor biosynthesis protein LarC [Thermoguttaceae bacterium]
MAKTAYLDCGSGISGDMTLAALIDAGVPLDALNAAIGSLGLPELRLRTDEVRKQGFRAIQVHVDCRPEHAHRNLPEILAMIATGRLSERQRELAGRIFTRLAEAEARVHGLPVEKIHFHEIGAADSIADIVGAAVGFDLLGVERIIASPVPTGTGRVTIAHGECSIPAPATAELLKGIPLAASTTEGELTTPTGAAILATLANSFGPLPAMTVERIGCGAGQKDFPGRPNILRLLVGEQSRVRACTHAGVDWDEVTILETNLDDLSGELIGYAISRLWDAGALDVHTTPIQMKKNRPAVKLTVLCRPADAAAIEEILFAETTTLGVRSWSASRRVLRRESRTVETPWGPVEGKLSYLPDGTPRFAPEYEACRRIAEKNQVALREVYEAAMRAYTSFPRSCVGTHSPDAPRRRTTE